MEYVGLTAEKPFRPFSSAQKKPIIPEENLVFPAPSAPVKETKSKGFRFLANSLAINSVSRGEPDLNFCKFIHPLAVFSSAIALIMSYLDTTPIIFLSSFTIGIE